MSDSCISDKRRLLMNDGNFLPLMGFGTCKLENMESAIDAAIEIGYRHFDTAIAYGNEEEFGLALEKAMRKHSISRAQIFLTSKIVPTSDNNSKLVPVRVADCLRKLRTTYLDLMLVHYPKANNRDNGDPENYHNRRECYLTLVELKRIGLIRSVGVSNFEIAHLDEIRMFSDDMPAVNQVEFHPHLRRAGLRRYCVKNGILFQAFASLGRSNPNLIEDQIVAEIAKNNSTTPEMILLAFACCQDVGVVPKSSNPERMAANFRALTFPLSTYELQLLNSIPRSTHYIDRCTPWLVE